MNNFMQYLDNYLLKKKLQLPVVCFNCLYVKQLGVCLALSLRLCCLFKVVNKSTRVQRIQNFDIILCHVCHLVECNCTA